MLTRQFKENNALSNQELVHNLVQLGNQYGKNVQIVGKTREERKQMFKEILYGSKITSESNAK